MIKHFYEPPVTETYDLAPLLDVCNDQSNRMGNTGKFTTNQSTSGWEDDSDLY